MYCIISSLVSWRLLAHLAGSLRNNQANSQTLFRQGFCVTSACTLIFFSQALKIREMGARTFNPFWIYSLTATSKWILQFKMNPWRAFGQAFGSIMLGEKTVCLFWRAREPFVVRRYTYFEGSFKTWFSESKPEGCQINSTPLLFM